MRLTSRSRSLGAWVARNLAPENNRGNLTSNIIVAGPLFRKGQIMRVYYNGRGQRRGYSLSGTEAYVNDWFQVCWMFIVVSVVVMAVLAVAALILGFFLVVGLLWCIGWTMAHLDIGGDKGPRLQARMASVFNSSRRKPLARRGGKTGLSAQKYNVVCAKCSKTVTLPAGKNLKCPSCRTRIDVIPKPAPGPLDPWLNEIAVALADLGLIEMARHTGKVLGGAPLTADIGLQDKKFAVYVNVFANETLAHQAEVGLRASPQMRDVIAKGFTILKSEGPLLYAANGRGGVVDEFRLNDVVQVVANIPLPRGVPARTQPSVRQRADRTNASTSSQTTSTTSVTTTIPRPTSTLDMPKRFTQRWLVENVPELSPDELVQVIAELRRRGWTNADLERRVIPHLSARSRSVTRQAAVAPSEPTPSAANPIPSMPTRPSSSTANGVLYFSGNGSKNLGTVIVPTDSTVAWTNDGGFFSILDDGSGFGIMSQGRADTSAIDAGTYHHVSIKAAGNWTVSIAPA